MVGDRLLAWGAFDTVEPFPSWARAASFVPLMDGTFRAANGACRLLGLRSERVFDEPWLATDLADYWGRRWNRFVGRTLTLEVFAPVKRRWGRVAGVLAAFLASGVLHELLFRAPLGRAEDGRFVAFFLVQAVAILAFARIMPGAADPRRPLRAPRRRVGRPARERAPLLRGDLQGGPAPRAHPPVAGPHGLTRALPRGPGAVGPRDGNWEACESRRPAAPWHPREWIPPARLAVLAADPCRVHPSGPGAPPVGTRPGGVPCSAPAVGAPRPSRAKEAPVNVPLDLSAPRARTPA